MASPVGKESYPPILWRPAASPVRAELARAAAEGILALLAPDGRPGRESGGLLLGRFSAGEDGGPVTEVLAIETLELEGPESTQYVPTPKDRQRLKDRLRVHRAGGLEPVGAFRTHRRRGLYLDNRDFDLFQSCFPRPSCVFLLARREEDGGATGGFFVWEDGDMRRHQSYHEFPLAAASGAGGILPAAAGGGGPSPATPDRAGGPSPVAVPPHAGQTDGELVRPAAVMQGSPMGSHPFAFPQVRFSPHVREGIAGEVMSAFNAVPRRGAEAGGILLGESAAGGLLIRDFEPVLCRYRFGPSFRLDDTDREGLEETLAWFRGGGRQTLEVAGLYRSRTRPQPEPDEQDAELLARYFDGQEALLLLLLPSRNQTISTRLFAWRNGGLIPFPDEVPFVADGVPQPDGRPARDAVIREATPRDLLTPEAVRAGVGGPRPAPRQDAPPAGARATAGEPKPEPTAPPTLSVPRQDAPPAGTGPDAEPKPRPVAPLPLTSPRWSVPQPAPSRRRWLVAAGVVVLIMAGGAYVGYHSRAPEAAPHPNSQGTFARPDPPPAPPAQAPAAVSAETPPANSPAPPAPAPSADRVQTGAMPDRLHETLDQWARAQRSGNPRQVASFYAPKVTRYLDRTNVSNAEVRRAYARAIVRRGVPALVRISDVRVEAASPRQATVRLRKRWQTRGPRPSAGEEEERLTLAPQRNGWKIVAEERTRVHWTHEAR